MNRENIIKNNILTSLEFGIQRATTSYHRAHNAMYSMTTNKQEYCSKFASAMLNNVAAVILREIKTRVSVSSSDRDAENIIRFHAHQLATFGTINREDVTSLAQRRVARVLNHIIDTHLNF